MLTKNLIIFCHISAIYVVFVSEEREIEKINYYCGLEKINNENMLHLLYVLVYFLFVQSDNE